MTNPKPTQYTDRAVDLLLSFICLAGIIALGMTSKGFLQSIS